MGKEKKKKSFSSGIDVGVLRQIFLGFCIFVIIFFVGLVTYLLFIVPTPIEVMVVPYDFAVSDGIGFNVESDMFHFGQLGYGGKSRRMFTLENKFSSLVKFEAKGDYANNIDFSENDFILMSGVSKQIEISMSSNGEIPKGEYFGEIYVYMYPLE